MPDQHSTDVPESTSRSTVLLRTLPIELSNDPVWCLSLQQRPGASRWGIRLAWSDPSLAWFMSQQIKLTQALLNHGLLSLSIIPDSSDGTLRCV